MNDYTIDVDWAHPDYEFTTVICHSDGHWMWVGDSPFIRATGEYLNYEVRKSPSIGDTRYIGDFECIVVGKLSANIYVLIRKDNPT